MQEKTELKDVNEEVKVEEKPKRKKTKATSFILPMLGKSIYFFNSYLLNCYVGDKELIEKYPNHIFVLLKIEDKEEYRTIKKEMESLKTFIESYNPMENKTEMFIFSIPKIYKKDYELFLRGKYSEFSNKLKEEVMVLNKVNKDSVIYAAFTRATWLRKNWEDQLNCKIPYYQEVLSIPNLKNEIYNNKNFIF